MKSAMYAHIHQNIVIVICTIVDVRPQIDRSGGGGGVCTDIVLKCV